MCLAQLLLSRLQSASLLLGWFARAAWLLEQAARIVYPALALIPTWVPQACSRVLSDSKIRSFAPNSE